MYMLVGQKEYLFNNQRDIYILLYWTLYSFVSVKNDHLKPVTPLVHWEIFR